MSDLARGMRAFRGGMRDDSSEAESAKLVEAHSGELRSG
jgi:Sec-independent protein translocase protein TatA